MSIVRSHMRVQLLELLRLPAFILPSIALPVLLYAFFGLPFADGVGASNQLMIGFTAFALVGVLLFDFGVNVAVDREGKWEKFLRTLPIDFWRRLMARVAVALIIGVLAAAPVVFLALVATDAELGVGAWVLVIAVLLGGSITFGLLGIAIGYFFSSKSASPVASLLYLPLAYVGGLWTPTQDLPAAVQELTPWTPTGAWADLMFAAATPGSDDLFRAGVVLLAWTGLFALAAITGFQRDEGRQYR